MLRRCLPLAVAVGLLAIGSLSSQPPSAPAASEDDPAAARLFAVLRSHTRTEVDLAKLDQLVKQLGHSDFAMRERASRELVGLGQAALARLSAACKDTDLEISRRAQTCIDAIETSLDKNVAYVAVCTLLQKEPRPAGLAELLLSYLPEADADTAEEIWLGMPSVAVRDGKVDAAVRPFLTDKAPARRALAALLLGRYGSQTDRAAVRERLADDDVEVRLRGAQGLLAARDKAAVPVLIALLKDAPLDLAWQAEELLHWLGGEKAPAENVEAGKADKRQKCHAAWQTWWKAEETRFDWTRVDRDHRRPGLLVVCGNEQLFLCGCDGKARWRMAGLDYSSTVQVLPGPRFLIVEPNLPRISERDAFGQIVWQAAKLDEDMYTCAQRLPNGNTFVACYDMLMEYGPQGQLISKIDVNEINDNNGNLQVGDAYKLRSGTVVIRTRTGVAELNATGGIIRQGRVERFCAATPCKMTVLANGHCLLTDYRTARIVDVDLDGKICWQLARTGAVAVEGLRNGNVVVGGSRDSRIYETTRDHRIVWEAYGLGQCNRIRDAYPRLRLGFDQPLPADFDLNSVANRMVQLKDKNPALRRQAATSLGEYGPKAKEAIPALVAALDDGDANVSQCVIFALNGIGADAVPALLKVLHDSSAQVQTRAWRVLELLGPAAQPALPDVVAILRDPKEPSATRRSAARVLGAMGAAGKEALPALLAMLKGDDGPVRAASALATWPFGIDQPEVIPALAQALKDPKYPEGQIGAAQALRNLGPKAAKAIPDLLETVQNVSYKAEVRGAAALAFAPMGAEAKSAIKPMASILNDAGQPEQVRIAIAQTFGALGIEALPALATFTEILRDNNLPVNLTTEAVNALTALGPEAVPVLTLLVNEGNLKAKLLVIGHLQNMDEAARSAIPALLEAAAQDDNREVRERAGQAANIIQAGGGRKARGRMMFGD